MRGQLNSAVVVALLATTATVDGQWTDVSNTFLRESLSASKGAAWGDIDGDGDLDLTWINVNGPNRMARNDKGVFVDATPPELLAPLNASMPVLGDYDNDGDLDLYIGVFSTPSPLYRNDGDMTFTLVDELSPSAAYTRGGAWVDLNRDGRLDVFASNNSFAIGPSGQDTVFINTGGDQFVNITPDLFGDADVGRGLVWADFDNDGDLDLFVGNGNGCPCVWEEIPKSWVFRAENRLYRNDGWPNFTDVTAGPIPSSNNARGVTVGDYDNDGDLDIFVVALPIEGEISGPKHQGLLGGENQLLRNEGNMVFTDATPDVLEQELVPYRSVAWIDYDNDGDLDLHMMGLGSNNSRLFDYANGEYTSIDAGVLLNGSNGRSAAWADYDRDGDLDTYMTFGGVLSNRLIRNDLANGNHWLTVELIGTVSTRSAIGARATVVSASGARIREVITGSGYWSQHMLALHFGLGSDEVVEELTITWPRGGETVLNDVAVDQWLTLTEPLFCPQDVDGDGEVGFGDLLGTLSFWGPCEAPCVYDFDRSGDVGITDLLAVLAYWGPCPE